MDILALSSSRTFWGSVWNAPPFTSILKTYFLDSADLRVTEWHCLFSANSDRIRAWYIYLQPNVGKYTIHGSYGICNLLEVFFGAFNSSCWEFGGHLEDSFLGSVGEDNFGSAICQSKLFPEGVRPLLFGDDPCFRLAIELSTHLLQLLFEVKSGTCGCFSAERCFSFAFSIFWLKKGGTSPKNAVRGYLKYWAISTRTPHEVVEIQFPWEIFHVELPAVKVLVLVLSVANSDIDFSELTSDVFRFFWVWCFQQNHPRDGMVAYPNFLFNSGMRQKFQLFVQPKRVQQEEKTETHT